MKHRIIPVTVGTKAEISVHLRLRVSLLIVRQVVPQGKWHRQKIIVHIAVTVFQPLASKS